MVGKVAGLPSALNKINSHLTLPILQSLRRLNFRPIPFSLPYLRNIAKEITTFFKKIKIQKDFWKSKILRHHLQQGDQEKLYFAKIDVWIFKKILNYIFKYQSTCYFLLQLNDLYVSRFIEFSLFLTTAWF